MSAPDAIVASRSRMTRAACRSRRSSATRSRPPSSKTSRKVPDAERAFERLAREGCKIIFSTSFGFMDAELKVAAKFPDIKFEHATGFKKSDNMAIYNCALL